MLPAFRLAICPRCSGQVVSEVSVADVVLPEAPNARTAGQDVLWAPAVQALRRRRGNALAGWPFGARTAGRNVIAGY